MNKYGNRLRELREQRQYTQETLAKLLGTSRSRIAMYERGERQPDFEMQEAIADFFNVTIDYLFGRETPIADKDGQTVIEALQLYNAYEEATPEVQQAVKILLKQVKPAVENLQNQIKPVAERLQSQVQPIAENLQNQMKPVAKNLQKVASKTTHIQMVPAKPPKSKSSQQLSERPHLPKDTKK